jgi:hypothetical protein
LFIHCACFIAPLTLRPLDLASEQKIIWSDLKIVQSDSTSCWVGVESKSIAPFITHPGLANLIKLL